MFCSPSCRVKGCRVRKGMKSKPIQAQEEAKTVPISEAHPISSHFCSFCSYPPVGLFKVTVNNWDQGEIQQEVRLCQKHLNRAQKEGEVYEVKPN